VAGERGVGGEDRLKAGLLAGLGGRVVLEPPDLGREWRRSTPAAQRLQEAMPAGDPVVDG